MLAYYFSTQTLDNFNANRKKLTSNNNHDDTKGNVSDMNNEEKYIVKDDTYNQDNDSRINEEEANNNPEDSFMIDPELEQLIAKLSDAEYSILKDSIAKEGIRESIIVWNNIIIDGHNRYRIAHELNIPIKYKTMDFKDREEAIEWIINNQLGRRNISKYERYRLALAIKPRIEALAKANQGSRNDLTSRPKGQKVDTREEIAKIAGVGHNLVDKVKFLEEHAPQELKEQLRAGKVYITSTYNKLKKSISVNHNTLQPVQSQDEDSDTTQKNNNISLSNSTQSKGTEEYHTEQQLDNDEIINESQQDENKVDELELVLNDDTLLESKQEENININATIEKDETVTSSTQKITEDIVNKMNIPMNNIPQHFINDINKFTSNTEELINDGTFYSKEEDLQKEWRGDIILSPPVRFLEEFIDKLEDSDFQKAIVFAPLVDSEVWHYLDCVSQGMIRNFERNTICYVIIK